MGMDLGIGTFTFVLETHIVSTAVSIVVIVIPVVILILICVFSVIEGIIYTLQSTMQSLEAM